MTTTTAAIRETATEIAAAIHDTGFGFAAALTPALRATAARVAIEVAGLVAEGTIPATAASWGELHSYVDANVLGSDEDMDLDYDDWSAVADTIDAWLAELPFAGGMAGVNVGDRVLWAETRHQPGGAGTVTAVDLGAVIVTTDDDVPVVFGTTHPRAEVLMAAAPDVDNVTGTLDDLIVVDYAAPADVPVIPATDPAEETVLTIEWSETVAHRTKVTRAELRAGLRSVFAEDPHEDAQSLAFVARADTGSMIDLLTEADGLGPVGGFLARRDGRDAVKITAREIVTVTVV